MIQAMACTERILLPWGLKLAKFLWPVPKSYTASHLQLNRVALEGMTVCTHTHTHTTHHCHKRRR